MYPRGVIILVLALGAFAGFILLLDGPLKKWVPDCKNITIGFCVKR